MAPVAGSQQDRRHDRCGRVGGRACRRLDVEPGARLPCAVQPDPREGRRRDHRRAQPAGHPLQGGRRQRRHPGAGAHGGRNPFETRLGGAAQGRQRRLWPDGQPEVRRNPVPGTGQLPACAGGRIDQHHRLAGGGAIGARAPGDTQADDIHARTGQADRVGTVGDLPRQDARSGAGGGHHAPGVVEPAGPAHPQRQRDRSERHASVPARGRRCRRRHGCEPAFLRAPGRAGHHSPHHGNPLPFVRREQRAGPGHRRHRFQSHRIDLGELQAEPEQG